MPSTNDLVQMPISVTVNGDSLGVPVGTTVRGLLDRLGVSGTAAVERNRDLVPRALHAETTLSDGDTLEVVRLVGGG